MSVFGKMNFPSNVGNNIDFKGDVGTRTIYPPTSKDQENYEYAQGFVIAVTTALQGDSGNIIRPLLAGQVVHFTYPAQLYLGQTLKIYGTNTRSIYAAVSLKSHDSASDGYVQISHIIKPAGKKQGRVGAGSKTQDMVADYVKDICYKNKIEVEDEYKVARSGSTLPDLVMTIAGKRVQFEIKGTDNSRSPITFFDISVSRSGTPSKVLDGLAENYIAAFNLPIKGEKNFLDLMNYYRSKDNKIGFAGDVGVFKSGKLPSELKTLNNTIREKAYKILIKHFAEGGDDFFVVQDRSNNTFSMYYVGGGKSGNVFGEKNIPTMPPLSYFELSTYGGASSGNTRVGLKAKL